ncbi:MAG: hypothetical protein H6639_14880 [Caldilineaceae bacterium]|nr:hypothetical protein [Caldilineaceae bacterium]
MLTDAALTVLAPPWPDDRELCAQPSPMRRAPLASLLAAAAARGIQAIPSVRWRSSSGERSGRVATEPQDDRPAVPAQPLVEPLQPRNDWVCRLVAQETSNRDIAARLHLTL